MPLQVADTIPVWPPGHGPSRPADHIDSSVTPFCCPQLRIDLASCSVVTSGDTSLSPIIGVLPSIAQSCAELFDGKRDWSWLNRLCPAWMAFWPIWLGGKLLP